MNDQSNKHTEIHADLQPINLLDILNISDIQRFQDIFANTHGVASIITNTDGTPITQPTNFTRLCKTIIRETEKGCANCFHSDSVIGSYNPTGVIVQPCLSGGLWDAGVSITVGGTHIANWLIGQVRNEEVDIEKMMQYADEIGADKAEYKAAFYEVPVMSKEQFHSIADLLYYYANELSERAFQNIELKKQLKENERITALLLEREENLRTTLLSIGDGVISTDKNGSIVNMNPIAEHLCGWKLADAIGLPLSDVFSIINSDTRETVSDPVKKVLETGKIIGLANHTVLKSKNGNEYQISDSAAPIKNQKGEIMGVILVFSDVTEKYEVEKALIESEMKYHALFETSNDVNMLIVDGLFVDCNQAALTLFDCERDQIIGFSPAKFSPRIQPNGRFSKEEAQKRITLALEGESQFFEWEHCRLDGSTFAAEVRLHSVSLGGKPHLQVIVRNVSEYKRSEQTISMLAHAIRSISECVSITDMEDNIIFVNKAFRNTYQYKEDELIGKNISIIRSPNNPLDVVSQILPATIDGGWNGELLNVKKDGTEFPVSISSSVIRDEAGNPVALIGITNNITEQKKAERLLQEKGEEIAAQNSILKQTNEELLIAKEKAQESDRLKSAFLANMSHEIRTPMNGILGFSELLKEPGLSGDEQLAYIDIIEKSGTRLLNIINDIVDISKIEAGLMKLNIQESNINEQIKYIYTFFKPEVEAKKISFRYKNGLQDESAFIKIDREKVYAILTNLVKNSIKFTEKGNIEFGYSLKTYQKLPILEFYVKDSGIGIPKERQAAVFERFIQADITDKMARQGAGLGLAISKAYVEMLGGKIWVESQEEMGSTFYFTLPY